MKKITFTIFIIAGLATGIFLANVFAFNSNKEIKSPVAEASIPTKKSLVTITPIEEPVTFSIPKINVTTSIESVAHDAVGNMDVPKNAANVAWYNPGVKPGEKGNAVLAGHYDDPNGDPAVFFNLDELVAGDRLEVTNEQNKTYIFTVTRKESYPVDGFPISTVFGPSESSMLNLITCEGIFNDEEATYSHRLVVFSELTDVKEN